MPEDHRNRQNAIESVDDGRSERGSARIIGEPYVRQNYTFKNMRVLFSDASYFSQIYQAHNHVPPILNLTPLFAVFVTAIPHFFCIPLLFCQDISFDTLIFWFYFWVANPILSHNKFMYRLGRRSGQRQFQFRIDRLPPLPRHLPGQTALTFS